MNRAFVFSMARLICCRVTVMYKLILLNCWHGCVYILSKLVIVFNEQIWYFSFLGHIYTSFLSMFVLENSLPLTSFKTLLVPRFVFRLFSPMFLQLPRVRSQLDANIGLLQCQWRFSEYLLTTLQQWFLVCIFSSSAEHIRMPSVEV